MGCPRPPLLANRIRDAGISRVKYILFLPILLLASCIQSFNKPIRTGKGPVGAQAEYCEIKTTAVQVIRDAEHDQILTPIGAKKIEYDRGR